MVYITGCALSFPFFIVEPILAFVTDLIAIIVESVEVGYHPSVEAMKLVQGTFPGLSKQVIVDLIPLAGENHILVSLQEEQNVSLKKTPSKRVAKEAVKELD